MKRVREAATLLGLVGPAVLLWMFWGTIPAEVPVHYALSGTPNRFAGKGSLWMLMGIALLLYLFLMAVPRFARLFNLPRPAGDPLRPRMEAEAVEMIGWMRLETVWMFAFLLWAGVRIAQHEAVGLGAFAVILPLLAIGATIAIYMARMMRMRTA